MTNSYDVIVIGGGPAGIIAAGRAAMLGAKVVLFEKMEKPARKLRITGKGRCNITNTKSIDDFFSEIEPEPRFLRQAFQAFFNNDIIELLNSNGLETVEERGHRVFPASGKAWDVAETLINWAKKQGATIECNTAVDDILVTDGTVCGVSILRKGSKTVQSVTAQSVIIATGGLSYPATGSTGDGLSIAYELGHTIMEPIPSLVALHTKPNAPYADKLIIKNVNVWLEVDGKKVAEEFGEVFFTPEGVDGATILRLSKKAIDALDHNKQTHVVIDLKPALSNEKLENRLQRDLTEASKKTFNDLLRGLMPAPIARFFCAQLKISPTKPIRAITTDDCKTLANMLKGVKLRVTGYGGWNEAIVTSGGVSIKEINPSSMESKLVNGLYFAGEVIDVDANTGGYNLQIAYSTGWLAGENAAKRTTK
ncbi:MAG: NAD(P)/FAD-dependent oxidoreductase [Tenuifilaceae bacterium]|nr:NAD(P)/FAD-dependent oxidoreductase [Tenuifilaceae bacterium]